MGESADSVRQNLLAMGKWNDEVGSRLLESLTPIYKDGPRHPLLLGTGLVLRFGEVVCVLTAAHVADDIVSGAHYFGAGRELHGLGGLKLSSPLPLQGGREEDRVDLAFWVIEREVAAKLENVPAISLDDFDLILPGALDIDERFFVNGYPSTRQPRQMVENEYAAMSFAFITEELPVETYHECKLQRTHNLLIAFDKNDVFRGEEKIAGPDLFGVSGGAVWRLTGFGTSLAKPKLAGIVISWMRGEHKAIVATRAHVVARGIVHNLQSFGISFSL